MYNYNLIIAQIKKLREDSEYMKGYREWLKTYKNAWKDTVSVPSRIRRHNRTSSREVSV